MDDDYFSPYLHTVRPSVSACEQIHSTGFALSSYDELIRIINKQRD
jgi:hypothetical protein